MPLRNDLYHLLSHNTLLVQVAKRVVVEVACMVLVASAVAVVLAVAVVVAVGVEVGKVLPSLYVTNIKL
jgi:hypothetical protein